MEILSYLLVCTNLPGGPLRCGLPTDMSTRCNRTIDSNRPACNNVSSMQTFRNKPGCVVCKDSQISPEHCSCMIL
jgi:hypothetical protein